MGKSIGIDLGTTNSVVAFKDTNVRVIQTGPQNEDLCRSCVAVDKSGSLVVGNMPYRNWKRYAPNIVVSNKRLMGGYITDPQVQKMKANKDMYPYGITKKSGGTDESVAIILNGKEYTPEQISSEILKQLKKDAEVKLGGEVSHAVITVPAYFNEKQKTATRKAAELAGLKVQRLLAEPTAAAISYGADKMSQDEDKTFLVYDFGGGTFDLSILVASGGNFIESGTGGDRWLGGDDIDRLIYEYVLTETSRAYNDLDIQQLINSLPDKKRYAIQGALKNDVESAKQILSQSDSTTIAEYDMLEDEEGNSIDIEVTLTKKKFEEMIRPLVQRTLDLIDELLKRTAFPIDAIDNILLVGGSSCIPLVQKMLGDKYGKNKILCSEKPMLAVAEGAAILSQSLGTEFECPYCGKLIPIGTADCPYCHKSLESEPMQTNAEGDNVIVCITTKHKYFIQVADDADNISYKEIIDENVGLPYETSHKFYTLVENQKIVGVQLFSNAEDGKKEHISTGYFTISENLPIHSELQFTFNLSEDEIMSAKVRVPSTGKSTSIVLSRGDKDGHCLGFISQTFDRIMSDNSISDSKKAEFLDKLQKIIDKISETRLDPDSTTWQTYEDSLKSATQVAVSKEDDIPVQLIIAQIQLENFGRFMKEDDKDAMRTQIARYKNSSSQTEKNEAVQKLDELTSNYGLFTHGFLLNIAGHNDDDPVTANKALVAFNQFMAALNEGNVQRARDILSANENLIEGLSGHNPFGGTTQIADH